MKEATLQAYHKGEDNTELDLEEIDRKGMDWINVAQCIDKWLVLVKVVMNFSAPKNAVISLLVEGQLVSQEGLCPTELDVTVEHH